jgi:hypothetical protein
MQQKTEVPEVPILITFELNNPQKAVILQTKYGL